MVFKTFLLKYGEIGIKGKNRGQFEDALVSRIRHVLSGVEGSFDVHKELVPMQPGDVPTTYADTSALERDFGFTPKITLREGLRKFAEWYAHYYLSKD